MSAHTPGPWTADGRSVLGPLGVVVGHASKSSVFGVGGHYAIGEREAEANARLIAAAPDLLDALRPLAAMVHEDGDEAPYPEKKWSPLLLAAKRAVDKAEGK